MTRLGARTTDLRLQVDFGNETSGTPLKSSIFLTTTCFFVSRTIIKLGGEVFVYMYVKECVSVLADSRPTCNDCDNCQPSVSSETSLMTDF